MSERNAAIPTHQEMVAAFDASPEMEAFTIDVDGVDVQVRRSALTADPRLGELDQRIERLVPYAQIYGEAVVVD